jgi:hypothetical protein
MGRGPVASQGGWPLSRPEMKPNTNNRNRKGNTMRRTLKHKQPNGETATRATERDYTHVTLIDGEVQTWHSTEELALTNIRKWIRHDFQYSDQTHREFRARFAVEAINNATTVTGRGTR